LLFKSTQFKAEPNYCIKMMGKFIFLSRHYNFTTTPSIRNIHVIQSIQEMVIHRNSLNSSSFESIGFIPTMGALQCFSIQIFISSQLFLPVPI
jgi:hypothetical protein